MAIRRTSTIAQVMKMTVSERILAVEEIWDSIAHKPDELRLTVSEQKELDRRLKLYSANPDDCSSWDDVRKRIHRTFKTRKK